MKKYLHVYKMLLILNFKKLFAYRADLISSSISHIVWATFVIVQMVLLTSKTSHVFGWTRNELLLLAALYNIIFSLFYIFFSRGIKEIPLIIQFGKLDGFLTKPIDSQFLISLLYVSYTQIIRLVIGFGFLWYLISIMHLVITPIIVLSFFLLLILSVILIYSFWMIFLTLVIWFPRLNNIIGLLYEANQISKFPQEMYRGVSQYLFFVLLPLTVIVVTPVKYLLQRVSFMDLFLLIFFAFGLLAFSHIFWKFALRFYTSASG